MLKLTNYAYNESEVVFLKFLQKVGQIRFGKLSKKANFWMQRDTILMKDLSYTLYIIRGFTRASKKKLQVYCFFVCTVFVYFYLVFKFRDLQEKLPFWVKKFLNLCENWV
jgi:hypothetical protein